MIQDKAESAGNGMSFPRTATPDWIIWVVPFGRAVMWWAVVLRLWARTSHYRRGAPTGRPLHDSLSPSTSPVGPPATQGLLHIRITPRGAGHPSTVRLESAGSRASAKDSNGIHSVGLCSSGVVSLISIRRIFLNPAVANQDSSKGNVGSSQTLRIRAYRFSGVRAIHRVPGRISVSSTSSPPGRNADIS